MSRFTLFPKVLAILLPSLGLLAAVAIVGNNAPQPASATHECPPPLPAGQINIRADIDGRSRLSIQGNTVQWQHFDNAAPGRHASLGVPGLPTYVNCQTWFPSWPDVPDAENRDCIGCVSGTFTPNPPLPSLTNVSGIHDFQCRHICQVVQAPTQGNGYKLVIEFDDNPPAFHDSYEVNTAACPLNISTGTDGIGNLDPIWTLVTPNVLPAYGITKSPGGFFPLWVNPPATGRNSNWIHSGNTPGETHQPLGTYVYETSFTVPSGLTSFTLDFQYAADNRVRFDLTGLPSFAGVAGVFPAVTNYSTLHPPGNTIGTGPPITVLNPGGTYKLTATVLNATDENIDPSGLLVDGTVTCVPGNDAVGGTVELLADGADPSALAAESSGHAVGAYASMAGLVAAILVTLALSCWYVRRRWLR